MLSPVFVKGHISFSVDQQSLEFVHQNISQFGVTGLSWGPLSASEHFGRRVDARIKLSYTGSQEFTTRAYLIREYTVSSDRMGLRFDLSESQKEMLAGYIRRYGFCPAEFLRKYPRIPSSNIIQTYPTRAIGTAPPGTFIGVDEQSLVFDVVNLSPNGVLLQTENQLSLMLQPGERLNLLLQPRGWFPTQIRVQGLICRVVDDVSIASGNLIRSIGIKFVHLDEVNKSAFLDLLKDVLEQLKERPSSSG